MLSKPVKVGLPFGLAVAIAGCGGSASNQASQTTHQAGAVAAASSQSGTSSSPSAMPGTHSTMTSSQSGMSGSTGMSMMHAHTGAHLAVLSPTSGTLVTGESVPFSVSLSNFKVDCSSAGTPDHAGVGHYHVTLDGSLINMYCGPSGRVSMLDVKSGKHMLGVIPATNEHADDMSAAKMIPIVYQPAAPVKAVVALHLGKPKIQILSPATGASVHGTLTMRIALSNFNLSCALYGKPDVAGYGHWHLNVDSTTMGMMGMGTMLRMSCEHTLSISLAHIKPGSHRFFAILEDNQHAPTPGAMASVNVNVQ
jgi:hypothetical protein